MANFTSVDSLTASGERLMKLDSQAAAELTSSWRALLEVVEQQSVVCASSPQPNDPADVSALRALRADGLERCLTQPLRALERRAPDRRAVSAVDLHASTLEAWIRSQPDVLHLSGVDAVSVADAWGTRTIWRWIARRFTLPTPVPLRHIIAEQARHLAPARARTDGEYFASMADALRQLSRGWATARLQLDAAVDRSIAAGELEKTRARLERERSRVVARTERALALRRDRLNRDFLSAVGAALTRAVIFRRTVGDTPTQTRPEWLPHWRQQAEDIREELSLAQTLEERTGALLAALEKALANAAADDAALHAELDRMITLLRRGDGRPEELQVAVAWTPAAARLTEIDRVAREDEMLPEATTMVEHPTARPARYGGTRVVRPRAVFAAAYERGIRPSCEGLFRVIEAYQREIADDLQRACDVVAFAARTGDTRDATERVVSEAVENAAALLEFRRNAPTGRQVDGMRAAATICRAGRDVHLALYGSIAERGVRDARRRFEHGIPRIGVALESAAASAASTAVRTAQRTSRQFLTRIGWQRSETAGTVDVRVRPVLPREFAGDPFSRDLPLLYRHLFRPDPVDDQRFLIGRESELDAIGGARERWESGRSAAVLITGERGSGKTSLINCALQGPLASLPIFRGEFRDRVLTIDALRRTIAAIVGGDASGHGLEQYLTSTKRVVVIEEFERAFLRHIGHYDAIRAFGQLINATSGTVLWIVVLNQVAFRFLNAMVGLGQRFSHRVNAGSATPDEIRQAILARHHLSGLRLRFEPPAEDGRGRWLVNAFGRTDAERSFFEIAARQSGGVYRTAFNVWVGHIGEIRDGLLTINAPAVKDIAPVIEDLALADLFTLVAVLQHGSLTPEEHAVVFQQPIEVSRAHIDELLSREIVEPDPGRTGYRVRPEAMGVVQEALFRRNLL